MIIYSKIRKAIGINPVLKRGVPPLKTMIEISSTGTTCRCIAHQFESAAGLNPNLVLFDELWGYPGRKFYDELTLVPTRKNPMAVIVTYAGYEQEGLLWDLYSDGMAGETIKEVPGKDVYVKRGREDRRMLMVWSHENLASWITEDYLESQRRRLPPYVYARFHENRWTPPGGDFITQADIDGLHSIPWTIQFGSLKEAPYLYVVAADLGLSHDRTARAVGHFNPNDGRVYLDNLRLWEGSADEHVLVEDVERDLVDCAHQFRGASGFPKLVVDPWQMEYVIQRLRGAYHIVPFNFSTDLAHLSQLLLTLIRSGKLVTYDDPILDGELRNIVARQTSRGWRIDRAGKQRIDCVIALGMMVTEAIRAAYGSIELPDIAAFDSSNKPLAFGGIRGRTF